MLDEKYRYQQQMIKFNAKFNSAYLQHQKEEIDEKKKEFKLREAIYYKPHFGPEDTEENVLDENARRQNQKNYIN